jgi:hypothetical protein
LPLLVVRGFDPRLILEYNLFSLMSSSPYQKGVAY